MLQLKHLAAEDTLQINCQLLIKSEFYVERWLCVKLTEPNLFQERNGAFDSLKTITSDFISTKHECLH